MCRLFKPFPFWSVLLLLLAFAVACAPTVVEPGGTPLPATAESAYPAPPAGETVASEPYPPPGVEPTLAWTPPPDPTEPPTPTTPPRPTPIPTPVVTPIPVAEPPFIPEVVGKVRQPFWIYYWQDNEVWRVDDQGQDRELLLDTYQRLGLYLTANPHLEPLIHTYQGQRVKVSPDGQELALVVVDKPQLTRQREPVTFSIYLYDIASGDLRFLTQGASAQWSPNSRRIAFHGGLSDSGQASDGGLWIADLETDQVYPLIAGDPANPQLHISYWMWSSDGQQIAYRYSEGRASKPGIWITNLTDPSSPFIVPNLPVDFYPYGCSWMPDSQHLLCRVQDRTEPGRPTNLWTVSIQAGDRRRLTQGFDRGGGTWSPDGKWLAFNGIRSYEREESSYDIWLVSADGIQLLRVTSAPPQDLGVEWSPDGTRLLFRREDVGLAVLSLETGDIASLGVNLLDLSSYNYTVGGIK